ncbi:MAG: hypothetical protein QOD95_1366 [Gammaproteobacteria bacterium]|nr:hypothetical protein [Gammaproteobacteria bacterium]
MPAAMDPKAVLPGGDILMLDNATSHAPFSLDAGLAADALPEKSEFKPLRPKKEPPPVADQVDDTQVLNSSNAADALPAPPPPAVPPPLAPVAAAPPAAATFRGGVDNATTIPPDTAGAVGLAHVFNPLNNNVWIFDRSGNLIAPVVSLNKFWKDLGIQGHTFDPRAIFDPFGKRYIFVTMADADSPTSSLLVAVSETDDPTKGWVSHAIRVDDAAQGAVWFDFPSVGFTSDKITIQINLFTRSNSQFAGSTVYAIDKQSLYDAPHQALVQRFILQNQGATHVPAMTYDADFADQFLLARWSGNIQNKGFLVCYKLSGNVATGSATLVRLGFITVAQTWAAFPPGDIGPQTGSTDLLSVGDDRLLSVCLRNGKLYVCHAIMLPTANPTRSAVQWFEIDTATFNVLTVDRIDDASGKTFYSAPSLAVNGAGQVMIGHAQFSASIHGSGAFTLRTTSAAAAAPTIFAPGLNTYKKPAAFGGASNRWGDYSHTQVDPNDLDFWTVQQFADNPADTWATMWTKVTPLDGTPQA